ncbi:MAG: signal peptidase II [Treponema sp.]|nr:signal peptidase II [Treponema sp.]
MRMEKIKNLSEKLLPLVLTAFIVATDQITKIIIVKTIPPFSIGKSFFGDLLRIVHVSNLGAAFSMGDNLPNILRRLLLAVLPLVVIVVVLAVYFRNDDFTRLQRWMVCGIVGGGLGNLIDRFFRAEGVVDFIDVKFFGLFGLERWPTFNVADSAVVVCGIVLVISFLVTINKNGGTVQEEVHVGK